MNKENRIFIILITLIVLVFVGFGTFFVIYINKDNSSNEQSQETMNISNSNVKNESNSFSNNTTTSSKNTKDSSLDNPLDIGEWGVALFENDYDIPVTVNSIIKGNNAISAVKEYCENDPEIGEYEEPTSGNEYKIVEYNIDLSTVENIDDYVSKINIEIVSPDDGTTTLTYPDNPRMFQITPITIEDNYNSKTKIATIKCLMELPTDYTDYIIKLGNHGTETYYKGK